MKRLRKRMACAGATDDEGLPVFDQLDRLANAEHLHGM